jgi:hypothetical protein
VTALDLGQQFRPAVALQAGADVGGLRAVQKAPDVISSFLAPSAHRASFGVCPQSGLDHVIELDRNIGPRRLQTITRSARSERSRFKRRRR